MALLVVLRFKLLYAWLALLRLLPLAAGFSVSARTTAWLHPQVKGQKPAFMAGLDRALHDDGKARRAWRRHKALVGVAALQGSYFSRPTTRWTDQCELVIDGAGAVHEVAGQGKGVLVMTYHHHFNLSFCSLMGRLGLPLSTIAMDARDTERFRRFATRFVNMYGQVESHFNGGSILYVKPNNSIRPILRAFDQGHLVITANDFPEVFDGKSRKDLPFLGGTLSCPTGTVKLAIKRQLPIVAAYLDWDGGKRFRLVIRPVSDGTQTLKAREVMGRYLQVLEDGIARDPGLWEGWKWLH